jgi:hypothetical protein
LHDDDHVRIQRNSVHFGHHFGGFWVAGRSCELPELQLSFELLSDSEGTKRDRKLAVA